MTILKRAIFHEKCAWLCAALIFGFMLTVIGCQQKSLPGNKATVQPTSIVISSPKSGALIDSPLIVQGTANASEGMVILNLIDKNYHPITTIEEGVPFEGIAKNGTFQAVLNYVPPIAADGYLEYFQRNGLVETSKMRLPIKFITIRSADPNAYPTAYVISKISMVELPGEKETRPIDKGSVVTVIKTESGWSQILVYVFDTPIDSVGWVPINVLTRNPNNLDLIEGRLRTDVALFNAPPPNGSNKGYNVTAGTPVSIQEKKNGWAYCFLPGGDEGWIQINKIQFVGPQI